MKKRDWQQLYGVQALAILAFFSIESNLPRVWLYLACSLFFALCTRKNYPQKYVRIAILTSFLFFFLINFAGILAIDTLLQPISWRKQTLNYQTEIKKQKVKSAISFVESLKIKDQVKNKNLTLKYSKQDEIQSKAVGQIFQTWAARVRYEEIPQDSPGNCESVQTISVLTCEIKVCDDTQYYLTKCGESL